MINIGKRIAIVDSMNRTKTNRGTIIKKYPKFYLCEMNAGYRECLFFDEADKAIALSKR